MTAILLEHAGSPARVQPLDRGLLFAELVGEQDVLPEPDDVMKPERANMLVALLVSEASIGRDGHVDRIGDALPEHLQQIVFVLIATPLERALVHRLPQQRCRSPVSGHQVRTQSRLIVGIELRPIERHPSFLPLSENERRPLPCDGPRGEIAVAQHPVELLDAVLRVRASRPCHRVPDDVDAEAGRVKYAQGPKRQRQDCLGVKIVLHDLREKSLDVFRAQAHAPQLLSCLGCVLALGLRSQICGR